jgi:hypothetical protein
VIVVGTQSIAMGDIVIVNGVTVMATTGSDAVPQIVYGTSTVNVAPPTVASSVTAGIGSYIMSGIAGLGSPTSSSSAMQVTTNAATRIGSGPQDLLSGIGVALMLLLRVS